MKMVSNSSSYVNASSSVSFSPWAKYVECTGLEDVAMDKKFLQDERSLLQIEGLEDVAMDKKFLQDERSLLQIEDMNVFGIKPSWEEFCLCQCPYCVKVFQPPAMKGHIERCKARRALGDKAFKVLEEARARDKEKIACAEKDPTQKTFAVYSYSEDYHPTFPNCGKLFQKSSKQNPNDIERCKAGRALGDKALEVLDEARARDKEKIVRADKDATQKTFAVSSYSEGYHPSSPNCGIVFQKASEQNPKEIDPSYNCDVHCGVVFRDGRNLLVCKNFLLACPDHKDQNKSVRNNYEAVKNKLTECLSFLKTSLLSKFKFEDKVLENAFDPSVHCGFQYNKKFFCGRLVIECTQHMSKKRKIKRPKSYEEIETQMVNKLVTLLGPSPVSHFQRRSSRYGRKKLALFLGNEKPSDRHLSVNTNSNNLQNQQKEEDEKLKKTIFFSKKILKPLPEPRKTCTFKPLAIIKFFEDYQKMNSTSNNCLLQVSSSSLTAQAPKNITWNKFLGCVPRRRVI